MITIVAMRNGYALTRIERTPPFTRAGSPSKKCGREIGPTARGGADAEDRQNW